MLKQNQSGQTLIEALVAATIVAIVLTAIISGVTLSVRNSRFSKNQSLATRYTQEAIESIHFYRDDAGWATFHSKVAGNPTLCLSELPNDTDHFMSNSYIDGDCMGNVIPFTTFEREAVFDAGIITDPITVTVTVTWSEGETTHESTSTTVFTDWSRL